MNKINKEILEPLCIWAGEFKIIFVSKTLMESKPYKETLFTRLLLLCDFSRVHSERMADFLITLFRTKSFTYSVAMFCLYGAPENLWNRVEKPTLF